jgi:hypothetical protein
MKETYDFCLSTKTACQIYGPDHEPISRIKGTVGDPLYCRIEEVDRSMAQTAQRSLKGSWDIVRTYNSEEIERAQLFLLRLDGAHASGEEYGTWYTDGAPNDNCGFERKRAVNITMNPVKIIFADNPHIRCALSSHQVGPLRVPFQKMRKNLDIFMLWGGEYIVSERFAKLIEDGGFTGGKVQPIWNTGAEPNTMPVLSDVPSGVELMRRAKEKGLGPADRAYWSWLEEDAQLPLLDKALWEQMGLRLSRRAKASSAGAFAQLTIQSKPLTVSSKTLFGENPFRPGSGESCKCAFGEVRGKYLLSPLSVIGSSWDGSDICIGDVHWMAKGGLFRPWRLLVISKRLFDAMRQAKMKGFDFEVVEMV